MCLFDCNNTTRNHQKQYLSKMFFRVPDAASVSPGASTCGSGHRAQASDYRPRPLPKTVKHPANPDPIMLSIMSLLASATVTDDGILLTNRTPAQDDFRARVGQIGFEVALGRESETNSTVTVGAPLTTLAFPKIRTRWRGLTSRAKIPTGKNNAFRLTHLHLPPLAG